MTRTLLAAALIGGLLPLTGPTPAMASASAPGDAPCSEGVLLDTERLSSSKARTNPPHERMHVPQVQEVTDGRGVRVAVIDSGIQPQPDLGIVPVARVGLPGLSPVLLSGHGTIVAGLIAGKDGVAPSAELVDIRVFDTSPADVSQGQKDVTSQGITEGIRRVLEVHRANPVQVVNIALSVGEEDPALRAAVAELIANDILVVASSGNAAAEPEEGFDGTPDSDEQVYPADYPDVLAVSAVAPPGGTAIGSVVPNRDTDVAAPTLGAISVNVNGQRCEIEQVATSWAAAEVAGVAALLRAAFPRESAKQVAARITATAEGSDAARSPWTGAGVVQARDALTRSLEVGRGGKAERSVKQDRGAAMPPPPPRKLDLFGSSRALLLWFGLAGGALMALAFMLRSLTRR